MRPSSKGVLAAMLAFACVMPLSACDSSVLPSMSGDEHQQGATERFDPSHRYRDQAGTSSGGSSSSMAPGISTGSSAPTKGGNGESVQTTGTDKRDINIIAEEVIEGKYANGEERRVKLGDRYDEVQELVNQKCLVEKNPACSNNKECDFK